MIHLYTSTYLIKNGFEVVVASPLTELKVLPCKSTLCRTFAGCTTDLSTIGPLRLRLQKMLKQEESVVSALVEVIAEPSSSSSRSRGHSLNGWPIR